jgi:ubiquinone/menaquinone biosynthesis C-methylase UbiE
MVENSSPEAMPPEMPPEPLPEPLPEERPERLADRKAPAPAPAPAPALSFGAVADAYDRARPTYPREAAAWLVGSDFAHVLEVGAGTGKLTEQLDALGHRVIATDPLEPMLGRLVHRLPRPRAVLATAEQIPLRARSVDVVVGAQAFHWFDRDRALPEIARVLRPGGHLGLVWNLRDERIPWVRRLGALIGSPQQDNDPTNALLSSHLFGFVETSTYRFWQHLDRPRLHDLVRSRSNVLLMSQVERDRVLRKVDEHYESYGRGPDGMLMPYVTHCYRAVVRPPALVDRSDQPPSGPDDDDSGALLIDFA